MIGQSIANYRILSKLDAGGMGEVGRTTEAKVGRRFDERG